MLKDIVKQIINTCNRNDVNKPSKFIMHLDENNLYGWAVSQYLPYGGFKWLNQKEIDKFDGNSIEFN